MKKNILLSAAMLLTLCASAQLVPQNNQNNPNTSNSAGNSGGFKPESGDWTLEMNFAPTGSSPLSISYLRGRMFLSETMALRTGVTVAMKSGGGSKVFDWGLLPGIEMHMSGTDRLSPYVGAELVLGGRASSGETSTTVTSGTTTTVTKVEVSGATSSGMSDRAFFNFGLNGVAGCDFYFSRHIYMGLEAGFGFSVMSYGDVVVSTTVGSTKNDVKSNGYSSTQLGPVFNSAIRLGFVF